MRKRREESEGIYLDIRTASSICALCAGPSSSSTPNPLIHGPCFVYRCTVMLEQEGPINNIGMSFGLGRHSQMVSESEREREVVRAEEIVPPEGDIAE